MASRAPKTNFGRSLESALHPPETEPVVSRYAARPPKWGQKKNKLPGKLALVPDRLDTDPGAAALIEQEEDVPRAPSVSLSALLPKGNVFMEAAALMTGRAKQAISIIATELEGLRSRKKVLQEQKTQIESQIGELSTLEESKLTKVKRLQDYMDALDLAATTGEEIKGLLTFETPKRGLHREVTHSSSSGSPSFTSRVLEEFLKGRREPKFSKEDIIAGLADQIPVSEIEKTFSQRAWYLVNQRRARQLSRGVFVYEP